MAAVEHTPHVFATMSDAEISHVKALLKLYNMTVVGVGAHSNVMTKEGINNLLNSIALTEVFDCHYIITGTGDAHGDTLPYADLEATIDKVAFIHLKDKLGENNEWNFPGIGSGNINFSRIFHILDQAHFKGPISVEIEFTPAGPSSLNEVDHAVKQSFNYLKQLLDGSE